MSTPSRWARLPIATLYLVAAGVVLELAPAAAARFIWERGAIAAGEWWRLLSGHLVHGSRALAGTDLSTLLVLSAWWELRSRARLAAILLASALCASAALWLSTDYARYVGSSALSSGLAAAAALDGLRSGRRGLALGGAAALALLAGKWLLELGGSLPTSLVVLPPGTRVAGAAHACGGLGGLLAAWPRRSRAERQAEVRALA